MSNDRRQAGSIAGPVSGNRRVTPITEEELNVGCSRVIAVPQVPQPASENPNRVLTVSAPVTDYWNVATITETEYEVGVAAID
jgi:hypothetical protein